MSSMDKVAKDYTQQRKEMTEKDLKQAIQAVALEVAVRLAGLTKSLPREI